LKIPSGSSSNSSPEDEWPIRAPVPSVRLGWIDYAKALAIVLVVFGHASRSIDRTVGLVWSETLHLADALIYSFHIPLFFVLAGVTARLVADRGDVSPMRGLMWGIAVPYVIWSVVWVGLKVAFPEAVNHPVGLSALLDLLWKPVEHMWFLQHLLLARLIWMAAKGAGLAEPASLGPTVLIAAMLLACVGLAQFTASGTTIGAILANAAFVGLGFIWLPAIMTLRGRTGPLAVAILVAAFWLIGVIALRPHDQSLAGVLLALAGCYLALVAVLQLREPRSLVARSIAFLGEASLAIYVLHSIVITATRLVLTKLGWLDEMRLLWLGTALGLVVPALLYWFVLAMSARANVPLTRWVGFGTATRSFNFPTQPKPAPAGATVATERI
jgi:fucose 4-O-acetylase-like acetyltransferase